MAVSKGKVTKSATQAADPAVNNLTGSEGPRSSVDAAVNFGVVGIIGAILLD